MSVSDEIDNVIREARHRTSTNREVGAHPRHERSSCRQSKDVIYGGVYGVKELDPEVLAAFFVVSTREAILGSGLLFKPYAPTHRRRNSSSARRRTSFQGVPADSVARTRRALRSISAAHAASTSSGCSRAASSRLASNSAATSARSSSGSVSASCNSLAAREVTQSSYTWQLQPSIRLQPTAAGVMLCRRVNRYRGNDGRTGALPSGSGVRATFMIIASVE